MCIFAKHSCRHISFAKDNICCRWVWVDLSHWLCTIVRCGCLWPCYCRQNNFHCIERIPKNKNRNQWMKVNVCVFRTKLSDCFAYSSICIQHCLTCLGASMCVSAACYIRYQSHCFSNTRGKERAYQCTVLRVNFSISAALSVKGRLIS